jgi:hypothetical protein
LASPIRTRLMFPHIGNQSIRKCEYLFNFVILNRENEGCRSRFQCE